MADVSERSLTKKIGSKIWVFPDAEMPEVTRGRLKAHESLIILNLTSKKANVKLSLFFTDKPPIKDIPLGVEAERVRCFSMDNPEDINGVEIERGIQYAWLVKSDIEIIAQYGRLDTTQSNMAFYTAMGFSR